MDETQRSCYVQPPLPPCYPKPVMRRLGHAQIMRTLYTALILSALGGLSVYTFLGRPRMQAYKDYYAKCDIDEMGENMAIKGLFQSVPKPKAKPSPLRLKKPEA